ncbi:acetyltransferase [Agarivorans albus]|uniref:acetyltransferase n=1 Tax=Agarivorans albus TaxID=182262 RepID=UPI001BFDAB38|nr:acetyltransferase [Agarivorans albus]
MAKQCLVVGCGSHASSVISVLESVDYEIVGLVDTSKVFDPEEEKSGYKVISTLEIVLKNQAKYKHFACFVAIGDNITRKLVFDQLVFAGFSLPNAISKYAVVDRTVEMGGGNIVFHNAIINANSILGNNNIVNSGVIIEHDCVIKDHSHLAPRSVLCGGGIISSLVFLGASSTVIPSITISESITVGAGAVVIKSTSKIGSSLIGVPAKEYRQ